MHYYFWKGFKYAFAVGYVIGILAFVYFSFQVDAGPPLEEIRTARQPIEKMEEPSDPLSLCWKKAKKAESNFLLTASPKNWTAWSEAEKKCREMASALP